MVLRYYHLREQPFGVTPDPRFLYASGTHREALASVLYGVESGLGFLTLTAKPGMGKTTLLFEALRRLGESTRTVFLFQTIATPVDLVHALLIDLGVKQIPNGLVEMQSLLNEVLVDHCSSGKRLVVAIDEAQNLSDSVLEAVRMLSNFETSREKLMQIILCGQPQLAEKLARHELLQLRQRISIFAHLKPLTSIETTAYIQHRLSVSGYESTVPLFGEDALDLIARQSQGIPRNINNLCFNAMSLGCAMRRQTIDSDVIEEVIADLDVEQLKNGEWFAEAAAGHEPREATAAMPLAGPALTTLPVLFAEPAMATAAHIAPPAPLIPAKQALLPVADPEAAVEQARVSVPSIPEPFSAPIEEEEEYYEDAYDEEPYEGNSKVLLWVLAACVIVVLFTWLGVKDYRALTADSAIHDSPAQAVQSGQAAPAALAPASHNASALPQTLLVEAPQGESLYDICTAHFGKCSPEVLQQIVKLNPTVANPDHVESGKRIVIPIVQTGSIENQ